MSARTTLMNANVRARLLAVAAVMVLLALNGCFLAADREITLLVTRTETGGSEATVTYRVPPPKEGEVYVLWVVNGDLGRTVRVSQIEPSSRLRAIRTRVDFWVTGAVISRESSPDVTRMSDESALVSGQVGPRPPTTPGVP